MEKFIEKGGLWQIRTKVNADRRQNQFPKSGYLWDSKEAAAKDLPLFVYFKSLRGKENLKIPPKKSGRKWFSEAAPDDSWDTIRENLSTQDMIIVIQKKRRHVELDSYSLKKKKARRIGHEPAVDLNEPALDLDEPLVVEIPVVTDDDSTPTSHMAKYFKSTKTVEMRKPFTDLTHRRQVSVTKSVSQAIDSFWAHIARTVQGWT